MSSSFLEMPRRQMLTASVAALAGAGLASWCRPVRAEGHPPPTYLEWKDGESMKVFNATAVETRRAVLGTSLVTPADQLYVHNLLAPPAAAIVARPEAWALQVEGVKKPRTLSLSELKGLGQVTLATVLQAAGNGRAFFPGKPAGIPWTVGGAGCVVWGGVPLRRVVEALGGLQGSNHYITATGGEVLPEGVDPLTVVFERSVPLATLEDALLVWELNGQPLPLAHGGPLRLIVPGYQGVNNVKYLRRLAFTAAESRARVMARDFRLAPPGARPDPSQPPVWEMPLKSWIHAPLTERGKLPSGRLQVQGVAFGGTQAVSRVEVSVDGGRQWQEAELVGPDLGRFAWRKFALNVTLPAGRHTLVSRVIDASGREQPRERVENAGGYNNNSWLDHAVTVQLS